MKKLSKRILSSLLAMSLILGGSTSGYAEEKIQINVKSQPKIDVALTIEDNDLDLMHFKDDLFKGLQEKGFDKDNINITAIETEENTIAANDLNFSQVVNSWRTIGASTWTATNDGKIYSKTGGGGNNPAWWGTSLTEIAKKSPASKRSVGGAMNSFI